MAYTPTEWETGDVITAAKLNNMETGISNAMVAADAFDPTITSPQDGQTLVYDATAGMWKNGAGSGGAMVVPTFTPAAGMTTATCDMTLQEILSAIDAKRCFFAKVLTGDSISFFPLVGYSTEQSAVYVDFSLISVSNGGVALMRVLYETEGITLVQQLYPDTP